MKFRALFPLCVLIWSGIALMCAGHPADSLVLMNDTGLVAYGLRATFDKPVSVTGKGEAFTRWVTQEGGAVLLFGEGKVEVWGDFYLYWEPEDAIILSYEWLSQPPDFKAAGLSQPVISDSRFRGVNVTLELMHEGDIRILAEEWNVNLVRILINGMRGKADFLVDEFDPYHLKSGDLEELDRLVDLCERYGIRVIIDLHEFIGRQMPSISDILDTRLWEDFIFHDYLISFWCQLAEHYANRGDIIYGYDLLNEPNPERQVPGTPSDWNLLAKRITEAIREVDSEHAIIIECLNYDYASPAAFTKLRPTGDQNTIYSVHFYSPYYFTRQGARDNPIGLSYPGIIRGEYWDKDCLATELSYVLDFQRRYEVPILVGEFGSTALVPSESHCKYLKDSIDLFEEYGFDWCYYDFRSWGIISLEHVPARRGLEVCGLLQEYVGETEALTIFKDYFTRNTRKVPNAVFPPLPSCIFDESHWGPRLVRRGMTCFGSELAWRATGLCLLRYHTEGPVSHEQLDGVSLLIVGTPETGFTTKEIEAIKAFVSEGGGLFIYGECGFPFVINDLLSIFGITFDTVAVLSESCERNKGKFWINDFNRDHWITSYGHLDEFQLVWSASLQVAAPAVLLAFTEEDTWKDMNDNEKYDASEPRGPFGMIAAAEYGEGRVVAIADTPFHSADNWLLLSRAVLWLLGE